MKDLEMSGASPEEMIGNYEEIRKLEKRERAANISNLKQVVKICRDNGVKKIDYGDVKIEFLPEYEKNHSEAPVKDEFEPEPEAAKTMMRDPDYLINHPPQPFV